MHSTRSAPPVQAKSHAEPMDKTTAVANAMSKAWLVLAVVGAVYPEIVMKLCSVNLGGEESTTKERTIIKVLTKAGFIQLGFVAALQGAACVGGSVMQANTRKGVMRAMNFANACWCGALCLYVWLILSPEMQAQGWGNRVPLGLSFLCAAAGAACYSASKGEQKSMFRGMLNFQLHSNTEDLEVPPFSKQNMVFLYWMGVSGVAALAMVVFPGIVLKSHIGDSLDGKALAWCKVCTQLLGFGYALMCVTLNLLVSSHLGSVLYHAVRGLFAAGLVALVAFGCLKDELEILGVSSNAIMLDVAVYAALVIMAAGCMNAHFKMTVK